MKITIKLFLLLFSFIVFSGLNCAQIIFSDSNSVQDDSEQLSQHNKAVQYNKAVPSTVVGARNLQELEIACANISYEKAANAIGQLIIDNPSIIHADQISEAKSLDLVACFVALFISGKLIHQHMEQVADKDFNIRVALVAFHDKFVIEKSELNTDVFEQADPRGKQLLLAKIFALVVGLNGIEETMVCLEYGVDIDAPLPQFKAWKRNVLMLAISEGKQALVDLLIAAGANVSFNPTEELTPLSLVLKTDSRALINSVVKGMSYINETMSRKIIKRLKEIH